MPDEKLIAIYAQQGLLFVDPTMITMITRQTGGEGFMLHFGNYDEKAGIKVSPEQGEKIKNLVGVVPEKRIDL